MKNTTTKHGFPHHLETYVTMNFFFWILWLFAGWRYYYNGFPWPLLPMAVWGIGLLIHYRLFNTNK